MTELKPKKSAHRNPSFSSLLNSEKTGDTLSNRENPIHAIFNKTYEIKEEKIRSSSFSSQMKSLFIKNLLPSKPQISSTRQDLKTSTKFPISPQIKPIFVLPTSEELNKKFLKLHGSEQKTKIKMEKPFKYEKKRRSQFFSMNFQIPSFNSPSSMVKIYETQFQKKQVTSFQINSGLASPHTQKTNYDKSQKSLSSFENCSISSRHKRKTSICKPRNTVLFRINNEKREEEENELNFPLKIDVLQGTLAKGFL